MDALLFSYVNRIKKHESDLVKIKRIRRFRRNQMYEYDEQIDIALEELVEIKRIIGSFGKLTIKRASKCLEQCDNLIRRLKSQQERFARRIEEFKLDDIDSDSYDDEFDNNSD